MIRAGMPLLLAALAVGCGDQIQFSPPPRSSEAPGPAGSQRIDPHGSPDGNPTRGAANPHGPIPTNPHGGVAPAGGKPGTSPGEASDPFLEEGDAGRPAVAGGSAPATVTEHFAGRIALADGVTVPPGCTLFVMAKRADVRQPTMVTRITNATFPVEFRLTSKDVFGPDTAVDQPLQLGYILTAGSDVAPVAGRFYKRHYFDELHAPGTKDVSLVITP